MLKLWKKRATFLLATIAGLSVSSSLGAENSWGTCVNDVGRGAFLWGTSDEVTTYSAPYCVYKTPNIYRIPTTAEDATAAAPTASPSNATSDLRGDVKRALREVGTIYGTDGKLYEYYYVEGVEPRRIIETRRVQETPKGGGAPIAVEKRFERIEWEPVLIRMLRPAGSNARDAENAAKAALSTPQPCERLGADERAAQNDPAASAPTLNDAPSAPSALGTTPPVESAAAAQTAPTTDGSARADGTARLVLYDAPATRAPIPVFSREALNNDARGGAANRP